VQTQVPKSTYLRDKLTKTATFLAAVFAFI